MDNFINYLGRMLSEDINEPITPDSLPTRDGWGTPSQLVSQVFNGDFDAMLKMDEAQAIALITAAAEEVGLDPEECIRIYINVLINF